MIRIDLLEIMYKMTIYTNIYSYNLKEQTHLENLGIDVSIYN